jgi:hypothetical protein
MSGATLQINSRHSIEARSGAPLPANILENVPGMKHAAPISVVDVETLSEEIFLNEYVGLSRPCVVKGAVRHWPATLNWSDRRRLEALAGSHYVYAFPHENHLGIKKMMTGRREISFSDALDLLHSPEAEVLTLGLPRDITELRQDIGRFSFLKRAETPFIYPPIRFFFYRNAGSAWHFHPFDETLMCQFVGTKKIGLLSARTHLQKVIQEIFFRESYYEDKQAFDTLTGAKLDWFAAMVEPGDALYIPPLWWHGVIATSEGFGATAAIPWRSPLPVIGDIIRRMGAGDVDLFGAASEAQVRDMFSVAKGLGLERELNLAWARSTGSETQI